MSTIKEEDAIKRMASYCARGEQSKADAFEKLKRWGIDSKAIGGILEALETGGFIDDERFCRAFVNDKFRFSKWGRHKIAQALYLKKIPSEISQPYLDGIDEEEYLQTLRGLIKSKMKSVKAKDDRDLIAKLIRFGMSRGFEYEYIKRCLDELGLQLTS